ncbi:mechanosensitive ion channel protein MscS [Halochromatium roseum]|nr:mechanosensitive ion channel protein MscS [Halochromatium roseum]
MGLFQPLGSTLAADTQDHPLPAAIAAELNPLRPPDTSSPRATIASLILNLDRVYLIGKDPEQSGRETLQPLRRAVRTLDLSEVPRAFAEGVGAEVALLLKEVIDRVGLPPYASIPDAEQVEREDLTQWRIPNTEILLQQVQEGPRAGAWLFSADTVDRAEDFFASVEDLPYRPQGSTPGIYRAYTLTPGTGIDFTWADSHALPPWLAEEWLGQAVWQWLAAAAAVIGAIAIALLAYRLARRAERRAQAKLGRETRWRTMIALMLALLLAVSVHALIDWQINFTGSMLQSIARVFVVIEYSLLAWLVAVVFSRIPEVIIRSRRLRSRGIDSQLLRLGFKLLIVIAIAAMVIDAADRIGLPAYSVLTGLGVGSLAIALAARETLANLLGSIAIMLDRPFAIGDWIKLNGVEGTVEDIGFRSTRIRTFYDSQLSVPNSSTMAATIDNMGRRTYRRVYTTLAIRYDTPPERIEAFVEGIKAVIMATPSTRKDYFHVVLNDFAPSSLDIMLYFFLQVPDWSAELVERQRVLLEIVRLAERLEVKFAFPTQTVEIERLPELSQPLTSVSP